LSKTGGKLSSLGAELYSSICTLEINTFRH
jgi:hypothetical protein